jgi:glycosidase
VHWLSLIIALAERLARYYLKVAIMTHYRKDTPQWLNEAIFYQIMPDRFARETAGSQNADRELMKWDARPGSSGRGGTEFYGGNLQGICAQLDHIAALGVNAILLTPINRAPSYHRYDAVDFCALDPLLGDWKDLERLVSEAHKRGLKLVFDIALNHVSVEHPWFQKALKDPKSKERSWFKFDKKGNYQCWWGYHTLPELQLNNPELQQMLFLGKSNVLAFWLDKGFDGIRLDCANDLTHETCDQIVESIRPRYPQAAIIGELCTYSVPWLRVLDATQSYFFTDSLKALKSGSITTRQCLANMQIAYSAGAHRQFQMLSSHDIPRIHSEWGRATAFLRAARRLQFTLPGIPMLYYGEELAMRGRSDPENRATPEWNKLDQAETAADIEELRKLTELRRKSPELTRGTWQPIFTDGHPDLFAFFCASPEDPHNLTLVTWNNSRAKKQPTLTVPWGWLFSELQLEEVFTGRRITTVAGMVTPTLEPNECAVWQVKDDSKRNYSFFKKRSR